MTALPGRMEPDSNQQEGPSGFAEVQTSDSNHYSFTVVRPTTLEVDQKPLVMEMSFHRQRNLEKGLSIPVGTRIKGLPLSGKWANQKTLTFSIWCPQ